MFERPGSCDGCPMPRTHAGFMGEIDGTGRNGVLVVAEALGEHEAKAGKALIGPAGFTYGKLLQRAGLKREDFKHANVLFCRPPNNKLTEANGKWLPYTAPAIEHCAPNLDRVIERMRPRAIVTLGEFALGRLTGLRGISACRGYAHWSDRYNAWVVPTFHPSYLMRGKQNLTPVVMADLKKAVRIAAEGYAYDSIHAICDPTPYEFESWIDRYVAALRADPTLALAFDIETPYKQGKDEDALDVGEDPTFTILRISFAYGPDEGVSVPWSAPWLPGIERLLGSEGTKICWNGRIYDVPRIRFNNVSVRGIIRDSMIAWHTLNSDLPKKLGFVTPSYWHGAKMWKHLASTEPEYYSAVDPVANWICDRGIVRDLKATGIWNVYERQVERLDVILDRMSAAGVLIDQAAKAELRTKVQAERRAIEAEIQAVVPTEIREVQVYTSGRAPKAIEDGAELFEFSGIKQMKTCVSCGAHPVTKAHVTKKTLAVPAEEIAA